MHAAAFSTVDITPVEPVALAGIGGRTGAFRGVDSALEANLLALFPSGAAPILIVAIDTLFVEVDLVAALAAATGLDAARIVVVASHTHCAPSLCASVPRLGHVDAGYLARTHGLIARAAVDVLARPPTACRVGRTEEATTLNVNRRRRALMIDVQGWRAGRGLRLRRVIAMKENVAGVVDRDVKVLSFADADGRPSAFLWSFAAHASRFPAGEMVSADFPGRVRDALRRAFGTGCAVLYVPGFAGSAIPAMPFHLPQNANEWRLALTPFLPHSRSFTPAGFEAWSQSLATVAVGCAKRALEQTVALDASVGAATSGPVLLPAVGDEGLRLDLRAVRFSPNLSMLALSGEMLAEWLPLLVPIMPEGTLTTGYLAGRPLYVPTLAVIAEGGYEAEGFKPGFGLRCDFAPDIEARVIDGLRQALSAANQMPATQT